MALATDSIAEKFRDGITACRNEKWREALEALSQVARAAERRGNLPGVFYSSLGLSMAHVEGRKREGLELCRYAIRLQPKEAENYYNLAQAYLMLGRRSAAVRAMFHGLDLRPEHRRLLELHQNSACGARRCCRSCRAAIRSTARPDGCAPLDRGAARRRRAQGGSRSGSRAGARLRRQ